MTAARVAWQPFGCGGRIHGTGGGGVQAAWICVSWALCSWLGDGDVRVWALHLWSVFIIPVTVASKPISKATHIILEKVGVGATESKIPVRYERHQLAEQWILKVNACAIRDIRWEPSVLCDIISVVAEFVLSVHPVGAFSVWTKFTV
jgi:hypothetical protein